MSLSTTFIQTPSGALELLSCLPTTQSSIYPPLLFIHGSFCSAHCYQYFLPYLANFGYPSYALSIRGHGSSWRPSWAWMTFFTTLDGFAADARAAFDHIRDKHPAPAPLPVVGGHSLGGGLLQYMLSTGLVEASGLILLASAPLSGGGKQIMANWERIEAPGGYKYPWSPRSQLETTDQVRNAFFNEDTAEDVLELWIKECRTVTESARAGLSVLWPFGEPQKVFGFLTDIGGERKRKVLNIAGEKDKMIPPDMIHANTEAYAKAAGNESESVMDIVIEGSGHHLMMDLAWKDCARSIVDWIEGRDLAS